MKYNASIFLPRAKRGGRCRAARQRCEAEGAQTPSSILDRSAERRPVELSLADMGSFAFASANSGEHA